MFSWQKIDLLHSVFDHMSILHLKLNVWTFAQNDILNFSSAADILFNEFGSDS